jgi:hypothetical protein
MSLKETLQHLGQKFRSEAEQDLAAGLAAKDMETPLLRQVAEPAPGLPSVLQDGPRPLACRPARHGGRGTAAEESSVCLDPRGSAGIP